MQYRYASWYKTAQNNSVVKEMYKIVFSYGVFTVRLFLFMARKYVFKASNWQLNSHLFQDNKIYLITASLAVEQWLYCLHVCALNTQQSLLSI